MEAIGSRFGGRQAGSCQWLAAYWAFQGWGNQPDAFDTDFKDGVAEYLFGGPPLGGDDYDVRLWGFDRWSYTSPTQPIVVFPDFRTMRGTRQNYLGAVELLHEEKYRPLGELIDTARSREGTKPGAPLVMVTGTPVLGHPIAERIQEEQAIATKSPYIADLES